MHIEEKILKKFQEGTLDNAQKIQLLEHAQHCDYCMQQLFTLEQEDFLMAPAYLKETVIQHAKRPDIRTSAQVKRTSRRMQLFCYSLRTATGVACTLFLFFTVSFSDVSGHMQVPSRLTQTERLVNHFDEKSNAIVERINELSERILRGGMER